MHFNHYYKCMLYLLNINNNISSALAQATSVFTLINITRFLKIKFTYLLHKESVQHFEITERHFLTKCTAV